MEHTVRHSFRMDAETCTMDGRTLRKCTRWAVCVADGWWAWAVADGWWTGPKGMGNSQLKQVVLWDMAP